LYLIINQSIFKDWQISSINVYFRTLISKFVQRLMPKVKRLSLHAVEIVASKYS